MEDRKLFIRAKKKRKRTVITPDEVDILETSFRSDPRPDRYSKIKLAKEMGKSENFISIWFQNRRARERRLMQPQAQTATCTDGGGAGGATTGSLMMDQLEPLDLSEKSPRTDTTHKSKPSAINKFPLFGRIIRMAAAAEGDILAPDSPHLEEAMTDACRGITLTDGRLLYGKDSGFQIEDL
ncbi:homeobox protein ceh-10-like [Mya arenaria]|uniref:homeobox protein ceh-10-like n=1 Tax=Mya arenaria TaxID=6604 RepID=UPI0022E512E9|nr:homeobox protein ceh-10-like [Mya arenaria]